ncbi:MFS transporter [Herbiconiux sp. L3-i23]|uniref:MFS transporter n=1 Tax=Herbiconiux sp. L3-i23 TaxID=2905871 RepID=UPI00205279ED|nr:MFS transporter [Herbiconiux sp. L3-i23]BDI22667.1 putative MFS transporter [Herbiconiux sp. L3-i23]
MTTPSTTAPAGGRRTAALVLIAIALTALNLRTAVTGFSPLLEAVGSDTGFGTDLYGAFGAIVTATFAVFGFFAAAVANRLGLERTLAIATAMTTAGILLRAVSGTPETVVITTIIAFAGIGTTNVLIVPAVKRYFADRLKPVTSMYLALHQIGQFVAPLIAVPMAMSFGWRAAIGFWAILTALAAVAWLIVASRSANPAGVASVLAAGPSRIHAVPGAWRTSVLWSTVTLFGMTSLNTYVIITWLPTILTDAGADPALGGALLALFSIFGLGAAFVIPPLTVGLRNPAPIVVACVALLAVGYLGLALSPMEGTIVWVAALGLGVSTFPMSLTLVNVRTRTTAGASQLSAATQGIGYAIACVGPLSIGFLHQVTGSWTGAYVFLFVSLGVMLVAGILASRPRILEDEALGADASAAAGPRS